MKNKSTCRECGDACHFDDRKGMWVHTSGKHDHKVVAR